LAHHFDFLGERAPWMLRSSTLGAAASTNPAAEGNSMRVAMICGSLQARSSNRLLLDRAAVVAPHQLELYHADSLQNLPLFNPDLEADRPLKVVEQWRREVAGSDALLIASPEYGHSLPGALKNAIDWLIGSGELEGKRMAITASVVHPSRGRLGLDALRQTLGAVSAVLVWDRVIVRGEGVDTSLRQILAQLAA